MRYRENSVLKRVGKDTPALFKLCVKKLEGKKFGRMDFQGFSDTIDIFERWVSLASLNLSNIGKVHPCLIRQFLLSKILAFTHLSYLLPKLIWDSIDIHPPEQYNDEDYQSRDDKS